jgi:hypothetical protein
MQAWLPADPGTIEACMRDRLEAEEARNLVPRSLAEITLYREQFTRYCSARKIIKPRGVTPLVCKHFVLSFDHRRPRTYQVSALIGLVRPELRFRA